MLLEILECLWCTRDRIRFVKQNTVDTESSVSSEEATTARERNTQTYSNAKPNSGDQEDAVSSALPILDRDDTSLSDVQDDEVSETSLTAEATLFAYPRRDNTRAAFAFFSPSRAQLIRARVPPLVTAYHLPSPNIDVANGSLCGVAHFVHCAARLGLLRSSTRALLDALIGAFEVGSSRPKDKTQ